jgi:hypothetical protein
MPVSSSGSRKSEPCARRRLFIMQRSSGYSFRRFLALTALISILFACGASAQQFDFATDAPKKLPEFYPGCSSVVNAGHFTLRFNGVQYDYDRQESFWLYVLEWDGVEPAMDYLVIGTGDCIIRATIITGCPRGYTIDVDAGSGIYGIKWEAQPAIAELHISFLLKGIYEVDSMPFAVKAGDGLYTGAICGVICEEECELSIVCPPDLTVDCDASTDPEDTGEPTAEGTCPPIEVTYSDLEIPGDCPQEKTIERTWRAEDSSGLVRQCLQIITVVDDEAPVVVCPSNITLGCNEEVVFGEPGVTDNCDPEPVVVASGPFVVMGPGPCQETHTMCWYAFDACGNQSGECCQSITVTIDEDPPVLIPGRDMTIGCNQEVVFSDPEVSDNCDLDPVVSIGDTFITPGPGPCQETHTRFWYADDYCGNRSDLVSQSITRTVDSDAPILTCADDKTIPCTQEVVFDEPEVTDNCDPDPVVTIHSTETTPGPGPGEITHTRCWVAEDFCGNTSEPCCQTIVQIDEDPPEIQCAPDGEVGCNQAIVFTLPEATDNCDADPQIVEVSYIVTPGPGQCEETHTKCWVAYDNAENRSEECCQSIVREVDTEAPVLVAAPDDQVACNQEPVFTDPEVSDNCDAEPNLEVVSNSVTPGSEECEFIYTRCWRATDECNNVSDQVCQVITGRQDRVAPVLTCQPDKTIPYGAPVVFDEPDVWDNCPGMPPLGGGSDVVTTLLEDGRQTFEKCWVTFDACGNVSNECCQVITMESEPEPFCTFGCWDWAAACLEEDSNRDISTFPACIRDDHFDEAFFQGVLVGLEDPPYHFAYWSSAQALESFECSYGIPKVLDRNYVDPVRIELRGVLVGELLALILSREFSCDGYFADLGYPASTSCYGNYVIPDSAGKFAGLTVDEFIVVANHAVGGDTGALAPYGANLMQLWQTTAFLNWQFSDCGGRAQQALSPPTLTEEEGEQITEGTDKASSDYPSELRLNVQPNPLKGSATVELDIPTDGPVQLDIYDIRGRRVITLMDGYKHAGCYQAVWNGEDGTGGPVASGVYFCRARIGLSTVVMEKMIKY